MPSVKTKKVTLIISVIVLCLTIIIVWRSYPFFTYVDRTIKSRTYISNYSIIEKVHDNEECYAKISISQKDGEALFKRSPFKKGYTNKVIAGKAQQAYIKDCPDCWYYIIDGESGIYSYTLYCLSADKKQLEIYECFGD